MTEPAHAPTVALDPATVAGKQAAGWSGACEGVGIPLAGLAVAPPPALRRQATHPRREVAPTREPANAVSRLRRAAETVRRTPADDAETSFEFDGKPITFAYDEREKQPDPEFPDNPEFMEKAATDIDESKAVGEPGITEQEAMSRALDVNGRNLRNSTDNRITKHTGVEHAPHRDTSPRATVSVVDKPRAVFDRNFGEVEELREIFDEAVRRTKRPPGIDAVKLKNNINKRVRAIIRSGKSPAAQKVREALRKCNYDERLKPLTRPKAEVEADAAEMARISKPKPASASAQAHPSPSTAVAEPASTPVTGSERAPGSVVAAESSAATEASGIATTISAAKGLAGKVVGAADAGMAVAGSLLGGWELGSGIEEMIEGHLSEGAVDTTQGAADLGLAVGVPVAGKAGLIASETGAAAGALGLAAGTAAAGSVALAGETARAALHGEKTPIDVADEYYGSHLGDLSKYSDAAADALGVRGKYDEASDAVHDWYRRTFL